MTKFEFVGEYEFKASRKMLFNYLSTASGLAQWFADDVNINEDKTFTIIWDGEENVARIVSQRLNSQIRFEFISEGDDDPNYVEFKIDVNELTEAVFIRVTDYSEMDDELELTDLWDHLMADLKEIVGG